MRTTDQNRVNMLNATLEAINDPKHSDAWKDHVAYGEGVDALTETLGAIDWQSQVAQGNPGASDLKEQTRATLNKCASEVIGAVRAYAAKNADPELAAKADYSDSEVTAGKANEVVARCKAIHAAATQNVDALGKYGITNAKLATFKKSIDAFNKLKSAPRQGRATKSAAAQLLPQLVRSAVAILRDQLDGLMIQFKEASPNFYEEYFAARTVVDNRGSRASKADATAPVVKTP